MPTRPMANTGAKALAGHRPLIHQGGNGECQQLDFGAIEDDCQRDEGDEELQIAGPPALLESSPRLWRLIQAWPVSAASRGVPRKVCCNAPVVRK